MAKLSCNEKEKREWGKFSDITLERRFQLIQEKLVPWFIFISSKFRNKAGHVK